MRMTCLMPGLAFLFLSAPLYAGAADPVAPVEKPTQPEATTQPVKPIFSQLLMASVPPGYTTAFENTQDASYIRESVPEGETVNRWTHMVTVTGMKDLAINSILTPKQLADMIQRGYKKVCPGSYSTRRIDKGKVSGFDSYTVVVSCGISPASETTASESALIAVIRGANDYYTVQWTERAAPSASPMKINSAQWQDKLSQLKPIRLCPIVKDEAAPYPSCLNHKD